MVLCSELGKPTVKKKLQQKVRPGRSVAAAATLGALKGINWPVSCVNCLQRLRRDYTFLADTEERQGCLPTSLSPNMFVCVLSPA